MRKRIKVKVDINKKLYNKAICASRNYLEELLKIADKYGLNRTTFMRLCARAFYEVALESNFDGYQFKEKEE